MSVRMPVRMSVRKPVRMSVRMSVCRDDVKACQGRLEAMRGRRDALVAELEQAVESNNKLVCTYMCKGTYVHIS